MCGCPLSFHVSSRMEPVSCKFKTHSYYLLKIQKRKLLEACKYIRLRCDTLSSLTAQMRFESTGLENRLFIRSFRATRRISALFGGPLALFSWTKQINIACSIVFFNHNSSWPLYSNLQNERWTALEQITTTQCTTNSNSRSPEPMAAVQAGCTEPSRTQTWQGDVWSHLVCHNMIKGYLICIFEQLPH